MLERLTLLRAESERPPRPLTPEQFAAQFAAAAAGEPYQGVTGSDRRMLNFLAVRTGLRKSELASLTRRSFDLDADPPAGDGPGRRHEEQGEGREALLPDIAAELRAWLPTRPEAGPVFRILERAFAMVCADLGAMGIPRKTEEGVLHFHALRHTYITMAARAAQGRCDDAPADGPPRRHPQDRGEHAPSNR